MDVDGDGLVEIVAAYGPAASQSDTYGWDGEAYTYREAADEDEPQNGYQREQLADAGLSLEVPVDWIAAGPGVWTMPGGEGPFLGVKWIDVQPPQEPEAALLPQPAQILESVRSSWLGVVVGVSSCWSTGEAVEGEGQAPIDRIEAHVLVVVDWAGGRRAFDVYVSAFSAEQLAGTESELEHALATVVLD